MTAPAAPLADSLRSADTPRARRDVLRRFEAGPADVERLIEEARAIRRRDAGEASRMARAALTIADRKSVV